MAKVAVGQLCRANPVSMPLRDTRLLWVMGKGSEHGVQGPKAVGWGAGEGGECVLGRIRQRMSVKTSTPSARHIVS